MGARGAAWQIGKENEKRSGSHSQDHAPILVGVNPNLRGQETINFVFDQVVTRGDHLVILHVLDSIPALPPLPSGEGDDVRLLEQQWFNAHQQQSANGVSHLLTPHRRLCREKQITVEIRIVRSSSVKHTLLAEATSLGATKLIVASSGTSSFTGKALSGPGRHCVKHAPPGCLVLVVANGTVVSSSKPPSTFSTRSSPRRRSVDNAEEMSSHEGTVSRTRSDNGRLSGGGSHGLSPVMSPRLSLSAGKRLFVRQPSKKGFSLAAPEGPRSNLSSPGSSISAYSPHRSELGDSTGSLVEGKASDSGSSSSSHPSASTSLSSLYGGFPDRFGPDHNRTESSSACEEDEGDLCLSQREGGGFSDSLFNVSSPVEPDPMSPLARWAHWGEEATPNGTPKRHDGLTGGPVGMSPLRAAIGGMPLAESSAGLKALLGGFATAGVTGAPGDAAGSGQEGLNPQPAGKGEEEADDEDDEEEELYGGQLYGQDWRVGVRGAGTGLGGLERMADGLVEEEEEESDSAGEWAGEAEWGDHSEEYLAHGNGASEADPSGEAQARLGEAVPMGDAELVERMHLDGMFSARSAFADGGRRFAWDDNSLGVKALVKPNSLLAFIAGNRSGRPGAEEGLLPAKELAAASGLARQGSGIPSYRLDSLGLGLARQGSGIPSFLLDSPGPRLARQGSGIPSFQLDSPGPGLARQGSGIPSFQLDSPGPGLARQGSGIPSFQLDSLGLARQGSGIPSFQLDLLGPMSGVGMEVSGHMSRFTGGDSLASVISELFEATAGSTRKCAASSVHPPLLLSSLLTACAIEEEYDEGEEEYPETPPKASLTRAMGGRHSQCSSSPSSDSGMRSRTTSMSSSPSPHSSQMAASANDPSKLPMAEFGGGARLFQYEEIAYATNGFAKENLIGKGGFAEVFQGSLQSGFKIAVKRLFQKKQSEIEFLTEVGIVSHVRHPHATRLLGYCIDEQHRLLIYELMQNGSLEKNLHSKSRPPLEWDKRVVAAIGAAKGLEYLHHECQRRIIHRDVKTANILLGPKFTAQIADFGLAKWIPERGAFSSLGPVAGTFGYMAPEYFMHGELNEKTDVFAFGVVLLEIITGRRPIDVRRAHSEQHLVSWAQPQLEAGRLYEVLDPRLDGNADEWSLRRMAAGALLCLRHTPDHRPTMGEVAELLEKDSLSDALLQKQWPQLVDNGGVHNSELQRLDTVGKEYTDTMYHRDMQQHLALALASPEGLVRST